ncbi:DUF192 domain-containing protein [Pelagibacterium nitratireducens]|uniref:DUF192 domain-containing protein n=1 Tax=Pelagibacterium nitratireducens TaxID=1046114 RepID=A0ABZ2HYZ6_9HYPH|nr:hypothetical protein [Pelagibacterium sp.]HCO55916.1 DUF192 domain-containing protein [Pelagibacterium sp.]
MRAIRNLIMSALMLLVSLSPALAQDSEDLAVIHSGDQSFTFTVEIADTPEETSRGLMFREELAPDAGMLFDFIDERPTSFWMQNTLIPLDMLFIKADGEIVRIHENAIPMDTTPIPSGEPVRFVLEIPGGRSAELGLEAGARLEHARVQTGHQAAE